MFTYFDMQEDTASMRKEIQDLRTNARIFQLSKCTACTFTLDLPAVHFMCMHSFHLRCLGDNEKECPECAPEYRSILETRRNLEQNARDQNWFFQQLKNSKDGFSVIADYFGKGVVSIVSTDPPQIPSSGSTWHVTYCNMLVIMFLSSSMCISETDFAKHLNSSRRLGPSEALMFLDLSIILGCCCFSMMRCNQGICGY